MKIDFTRAVLRHETLSSYIPCKGVALLSSTLMFSYPFTGYENMKFRVSKG